MLGNDKGEFLGLTPRNSFLAGLLGGILVLCTVGFFILLVSAIKGNGFFDAGRGLAANKPTTIQPTDTGTAADPGQVPPVSERDHVFGDKKAAVTLIEYSDYECPFCKQFHPTMARLMQEYEGKVNWVLRHYPLSFHQNAQKEAEAAECIAELGGNDKFWDYSSTIFERTTSNGTGFALADLPALAKELGVNQSKFEDCLNSGKYADVVAQDLQGGVNAGVTGTPGTIVMNKDGEAQLIPGAVSYEELKRVVDALLK